jgi:hypothetical protein
VTNHVVRDWTQVQGDQADFCHPGLEYMITSFFFGKENSIGNIYQDHDDYKQVPHAMLGLVAVAVSSAKTFSAISNSSLLSYIIALKNSLVVIIKVSLSHVTL